MSDNGLEDMNETVFLTGATGALGPVLAAELLASGAAPKLRVLIRGGDTPAITRFNQWIGTLESTLAASGSLLPNPRKRVGVIEGDLCAPDLAMSPAQQAQFCDETEIIIHAAADTNFRGQMHWETNVEGTRRLLDLARKCRRLKKLVFVSTICVAGIQSGLVREEPVVDEPRFANAYERTKWAAERLVLDSDLPIEIVRVGIVMGSTVTGEVHRLGALHHVFKWFGSGHMPVVPGQPTTLVDLIDSELAAKVIRKAAQTDAAPGAIYHAAAGRRAVLLQDLCRFCSQQMHDEILEASFRTLGHHETHSRAHERLAKAWLPVLLASRTYDTSRAEALWGGPLPLSDWRQTLAKVLRFCGYVDQQRV